MSAKNELIKAQIDSILKSESVGRDLTVYFDNMPKQSLRRAIKILSEAYPDKVIIPQGELEFISYMLSSKEMAGTESFSNFVRSISAINYSTEQKNKLIAATKKNIFTLCESLNFEFDNFLALLLNKEQLVDYAKWMISLEEHAVLTRAAAILRYENFDGIPVEKIDELKQHLKNKMQIDNL